jgi:hypothetical protein
MVFNPLELFFLNRSITFFQQFYYIAFFQIKKLDKKELYTVYRTQVVIAVKQICFHEWRHSWKLARFYLLNRQLLSSSRML